MSKSLLYLPEDNPRILFDSEDILGSGGYCSVCNVLELDSTPRDDLVIKRLKREGNLLSRREKTKEEIRLLRKLAGSGCVPHVVLSDISCPRPWYVTDKLHPLRVKNLLDTLRIIREIADALEYVHSRGIAHRDVKTDNILMRDDGTVVLCDYGISVDSGTPAAVFNYVSLARRSYDVPSELLNITEELAMSWKDKIRILQSSDIYMFGYCIFELLTGMHLRHPDRDFSEFRKHVNTHFGCSIDDRVLAFLFRTVSESTRKDYCSRFSLNDVRSYIDKAMTFLLGNSGSASDIDEASAVIHRATIHRRIDSADCVVFSSPEDIDELLKPVLRDILLIHEGKEIEFSDISVENGTVTMTLAFRVIRFSVGRLISFNNRDDMPLLRIETSALESAAYSDVVFNPLQDILSHSGEVITVFSAYDRERYHKSDCRKVMDKCTRSLDEKL